MSFSNTEQGHHKETLLPRASDIDALVRAEHHDPFAILGPHGDDNGGQFIRAYLPDALSVQVLAKDSGEELGSLEATQTPGLFVGHFNRAQPYLLCTRWPAASKSPKTLTASGRCSVRWTCICLPKAITAISAPASARS